LANTFSRRSPVTADLLKDVQYRQANRLFDKEDTLDLGNVRVRLLSLGPAHTRGDTAIFVEPDGALFTGDIVMNRFLAFASPSSGVTSWLAALDALMPLQPRNIVPSHGDLGDATLIQKNRSYLLSLQLRVKELKAQGRTAEEAADTIAKELSQQYPEWTNTAAIAPAARAAYIEAR
jgi:cyclase